MSDRITKSLRGRGRPRGRGRGAGRGRGRGVARGGGRGIGAAQLLHGKGISQDTDNSPATPSNAEKESLDGNIEDVQDVLRDIQEDEEVVEVPRLKRIIEDLKKELDQKKKEVDDLAKNLNDSKQEVFNLESDLTEKKNHLMLLRMENSKLKKQVQSQKLEIDGIRKLKDEFEESIMSRGGGDSLNTFHKRLKRSMDAKYITLAKHIERSVSKQLIADTMEIEYSEEEEKVRKWAGRCEEVAERGIEVKNHSTGATQQYVPPCFQQVVNSKETFHTSCFVSQKDLLLETMDKVLQSTDYINFWTDEDVRKETVAAISENHVMISKMKDTVSSSISARKRDTKDELFHQLHYFSLRSRHDSRRETELFSRPEEIRLAKEKLLRKEGETWDYSWWRTGKITDLSVNGEDTVGCDLKKFEMDVCNPSAGDDEDEAEDGDSMNNDISTGEKSWRREDKENDVMADEDEDMDLNVDCYGIMHNEISRHIYLKFLGYDPYADEDKVTATSFLNISRLDAWIATVVMLLTDEDLRGGGRQKIYNSKFHENYRNATFQLNRNICKYVKYWAPNELEVPECVRGEEVETILNMERDATVVVLSKKESVYYIAVHHEWFKKYISAHVGTIHDCYLAKFTTPFDGIHFLHSEETASLAAPDVVPSLSLSP